MICVCHADNSIGDVGAEALACAFQPTRTSCTEYWFTNKTLRQLSLKGVPMVRCFVSACLQRLLIAISVSNVMASQCKVPVLRGREQH